VVGWPDQAHSRIKQGLGWAKKLEHAFSLSFALFAAAHVRLWCGDLDDAGRLATESLSLAREHGVVLYTMLGGILQACIRVQRREPEAGLSLLTEGLSQYRVVGALDLLPLYLGFAADAYQ
jgi:predicted ATPase